MKDKEFSGVTNRIKAYEKVIQMKQKRERTEIKKYNPEKHKRQVKLWTTFFRRNINLYIEWRLGIHLHPFQHLMIYLISISDRWFGIASRGISKKLLGLSEV